MSSRHDSHNQPPWGHHYDAPAPSSVPNAFSGDPSTHTHYPAPPTGPPVSQQYLPTGPYAHPASHYQQMDAGVFPSSSGYHALPLGPQKTSYIAPAAKFVCRQKVKARITTDAWVIGIIVGALQVCSKFTGLRYNVQFESVEGSGQYETRDFSAEDLCPYRPREPEYPNRSRR